MNVEKLFSQALGISDPWYIKSVNFNSLQKKLDIEVNFKRGSTFVDKGECKAYKAYDTIKKSWKHLNFFEHECYLNVRTPRIKKKNGSVKLIPPPWSGVIKGFTLLFEAFLLQLCRHMPVQQVGKLAKISDYKIWSMLDKYTETARLNEDYSKVTTIGIDETSVTKGHQYISLFVDLHNKKTIFISDGKNRQTITNFGDDLKSHQAHPKQITEVSCDMSPAFIKGVKTTLLNANITFDKFHILKIINTAVDTVSRAEATSNPNLKNTRYIFLKNDKNLTVKQRKKKEELSMSKLNLKSMRAMHIRENFQQIYLASSIEEFQYLLKKWYSWAIRSKLHPMVKVAKTIKTHWEGIIRWKVSQINNAILEGLNSVLQASKRKAKGYKIKHFKTIAYLVTGKLNYSIVNRFCLPT